MKTVKVSVLIGIVALLLSAFISFTVPSYVFADNVGDVAVEFTMIDSNEIIGKVQDLNTTFHILRNNSIDEMTLEMDDIVVVISTSTDATILNLQVNSYNSNDNNPANSKGITLNDDNIQEVSLLSKALEKYRGTNNLGDVFFNDLSLIVSWPPGAPLKALLNDQTISIGEASMSRSQFNNTVKSVSTKSYSYTSICGDYGRVRSASFPSYFRYVFPLTIEVGWTNTNSYVGTKDVYLCNGRCGSDCGPGSMVWGLTQDIGLKNYTQNCLNHDECSLWKGFWSLECMWIFGDSTVDYALPQGVQKDCDLPEIKSVSPSSGKSGDTITITGVNFGSSQGNGVYFNDNDNPGKIISWNSSEIKVVVPGWADISATIIVDSSNNGVAYKDNAFSWNYSPAPQWT
ncbi:MAG: IPT/TIG domain-containing protein, partial [Nitrospirae bacterium]|nr:IPT/TIG domain-containing protein [Nitrospirota bacterium]